MSTKHTAEDSKQKILNKVIARRKNSHKNDNCIATRSEQSSHTRSDLLTKMAIEEIFRETAKGAVRAETAGPFGWLPCPLLKTNKRFLSTTIKSVITHNKRQEDRIAPESSAHSGSTAKRPKKSEKELDDIIAGGKRRTPKFGERKHCFRKVDKTGNS